MSGFKSQDDNPNSFIVKTNEKDFRLDQDVSDYVTYAERMREQDAINPRTTRNFRSFAIIPDIVAIDILTKYGINIHDPTFMHDEPAKKKFKHIIMTEYPNLLTSNVKK